MKNTILILIAVVVVFGSGFYVNELRWQGKFSEYQLAQKAESDAVRKQWEERLDEADTVLADARSAESRSRDELEWMRQRTAGLERDAKTAEAKWGARCAKLAVRYREAVDRVKPALEFCASILK